jgi:hypothetical protein
MGSAEIVMIGIIAVARFAATAGGVPAVMMMSTLA